MNNNIDERDDIEYENMENHNIRNRENDYLGDLQNVRQRVNTTLRPLDDSLSGSPLMTRTEPVSLHALMGTRDQIPRNSRLDLQLLRIISNYNANGSNSVHSSQALNCCNNPRHVLCHHYHYCNPNWAMNL